MKELGWATYFFERIAEETRSNYTILEFLYEEGYETKMEHLQAARSLGRIVNVKIVDPGELEIICALRILLCTQALTVTDKVKEIVKLTPTQNNSQPI